MSGSLMKIIVGALLIVVSGWWIVQGSGYIEPLKTSTLVTSRPALADFITLLNGGIPPFVALIGLLMVWLEWDSFKTQKQAPKEEKKSK